MSDSLENTEAPTIRSITGLQLGFLSILHTCPGLSAKAVSDAFSGVVGGRVKPGYQHTVISRLAECNLISSQPMLGPGNTPVKIWSLTKSGDELLKKFWEVQAKFKEVISSAEYSVLPAEDVEAKKRQDELYSRYARYREIVPNPKSFEDWKHDPYSSASQTVPERGVSPQSPQAVIPA